MSREDVQDLMATMKTIYPNFKTPDMTAVVNTWYALLKDENAPLIFKAFESYCKTNVSGFAPSPGQLLQLKQNVLNVGLCEGLEKRLLQRTHERISEKSGAMIEGDQYGLQESRRT